MNLAVQAVGATIASFVAGLYAILAAVLGPILLRERLRARALAGFVVAVVGTALLAELDLGSPAIGGIGWGLLAAVSFALFLVLSRRWAAADGFDGLVVALATMGTAAVGLGAVVLVFAPATLAPGGVDAASLLAIAWLALVAAAGQALAVASLRRLPAARTAAFLLLNPITATILSAVLLGQVPTMTQLLGGALVLVGIAAATL
jgi:drug/metabolite transporter (DMT)-like permease